MNGRCEVPLSLFGKLPTRGDFVVRGAQGDGERALAHWLTRAVEVSQGSLPSDPVRFIASHQAGLALVGTWVASRDAVGRGFPLSVSCRVPRDVQVVNPSLLPTFYGPLLHAAESALAASLELDLPAVERAAGQLEQPHPSALPGLLQRSRDLLTDVSVHAFAERSFARWPVDSLGYALATLQRAVALRDPELTLDMPVGAEADVSLWLTLLFALLAPADLPSLVAWSPALRRLLVCLDAPSPQLLLYLMTPDHPSQRRWPLWTACLDAARTSSTELSVHTACCLHDNGTLLELVEHMRSPRC